MINVLHVITGLNLGGAETSLCRLVSGIDKIRFNNSVVTIMPPGPLADYMELGGIKTICLNYARGIPNPLMIRDIAKIINEINPDIIQTWMYHSGLAVSIASFFSRQIPVIWNLRTVDIDRRPKKYLTRAVVHISARLSYWLPARIVVNSIAGKDYHESIGFCRDKITVIPNGFDLTLFRRDGGKREQVRTMLGLALQTRLVGLIARFDPDKDIPSFLKAARLTTDKFQDSELAFVLVGDGMSKDNRTLVGWIHELEMDKNIFLLGPRDDIAFVINSLDLLSLTSSRESFPNVVGEAMACEVPCVVTDVGDCAKIVGDTGITVPVDSPEKLAQAWLQILNLSESQRKNLGSQARQRIIDNFDLSLMLSRYQELYLSVASSRQS